MNDADHPSQAQTDAGGPIPMKSFNPSTMEEIGEVNITPPEQVEQIVCEAREAFPAWRDLGLKKRASTIKKGQQLLLERCESFARLITAEMGRPYVEALALEVEAAADLMGYYSRNAKTFLSDRKVSLGHPLFKRRMSRFLYEPLGVLGIISPWNWPLLIPMGCIVPALLSGNAVVFKHSELTPLIAEKMKELFIDAGVPEKVMQVVQGSGETGKALVDSSVEKIFFTGSTGVGQKVMQQAAGNLKKVVLELGGSDPAIICQDADIDITASGIAWGGFNNCGQNCNSIERAFVHEKIAEEFIQKLQEKTASLKIGDGMNQSTDIGPLTSEAQFNKIVQIIAAEIKNGSEVLLGGNPVPSAGKGFFYEPTIILRDKNQTQPVDLEVFGPIVLVTIVSSDEEAVRLANDSSFGLTASVWTADKKRGLHIARQLQTGSVMINDSIVSFGMPEADWTGIKNSGIGWVHGEKGLDEMVNIKYLNYEPQFHTQKFWWFPYSRKMSDAMHAVMHFLFSQKITKRLKALPPIIKNFTGYLLRNRKRKDKL
jgi:succinate-semialdehyde dehydrogenase/glutarate-semialdehyde dehydrogenase